MPLENVTEGQRRHVIRLAYRFRRQMPRDLVPSNDAIKALDAAWNEAKARQADAQRCQPKRSNHAADCPPLLGLMESRYV